MDHTIGNSALIEMSGNLVAVAGQTEKVTVGEESKATNDVEEVSEATEDAASMVSVEAVVVYTRDK